MESLREVIKIHEKVPMDDPQDRPDLYILAPMRLLSPIMEESAITETNKNATNADLNKSLMTVISDILTNAGSTSQHYATASSIDRNSQHYATAASTIDRPTGSSITTGALICNNNPNVNTHWHFQDSNESQSSLDQTIEEIRNNSLCNLYYLITNEIIKPSQNKAVPQVPPRNEDHQTAYNKVSTSHSRRPSRIVEEHIEDITYSPAKNQQCRSN